MVYNRRRLLLLLLLPLKLKLSLHLKGSTLYGLVDLFWPLYLPSKVCGSVKKSMMNLVLRLYTVNASKLCQSFMLRCCMLVDTLNALEIKPVKYLPYIIYRCDHELVKMFRLVYNFSKVFVIDV